MKRTNRLMLVLGIALAVAAFAGVLVLGSGTGAAQEPEIPPVTVVTAATDLPIGAALTVDNLKTVEKPANEALDTYRTATELEGRVLRRSVAAGQALAPRDFQTDGVPAPAEVVSNLRAGLRAVAVGVDQLGSVGAVVQPGDRVDVILAVADSEGKFPVVVSGRDIPPPAEGQAPFTKIDDVLNNTSVKVIVENVQVLAVIPPQAPANTNLQAPAPAAAQTVVVLAVSPQQAELVRFAQLDGNITLALRSPADADAAASETSGITLRQLVDEYGVLPPRVTISQYP